MPVGKGGYCNAMPSRTQVAAGSAIAGASTGGVEWTRARRISWLVMQAHGEYYLERHGQVLLIGISGAWNSLTFDRYAEDLRRLMRAMAEEGAWVLVMDGRQWELATPDVLSRVRELAGWADRQGLSGAVIISGGDMLKESVARDTIFSKDRRAPAVLVRSAEDALAWVEKWGFTVSDELRERLAG